MEVLAKALYRLTDGCEEPICDEDFVMIRQDDKLKIVIVDDGLMRSATLKKIDYFYEIRTENKEFKVGNKDSFCDAMESLVGSGLSLPLKL